MSLKAKITLGHLSGIVLVGAATVFALYMVRSIETTIHNSMRSLVPETARLQWLSRQLFVMSNSLERATRRDLVWLARHIPEIRLYQRLEEVAQRLTKISRTNRSDIPPEVLEKISALAQRARAISQAHSHGEAERGTLIRLGLGRPEKKSNRQVFEFLVSLLTDLSRIKTKKPQDQVKTVIVTKLMHDHLIQLQKDVLYLLTGLNNVFSAVFKNVETRQRQGLIVASIVAGVGLLLSAILLLLNLRALRPLNKLRVFARKISLGKYNEELPPVGSDEIGSLAQELRGMAVKLKEREEQLKTQSSELLKSERLSAIGKMSTQIAHEIRNPLNALGLKLDLLEEEIESSDRLEYQEKQRLLASISAVNKELARLREITDYYLKFARFPKPEKEKFELSVLMSDVLGFYKDTAEKKGVSLSWEVEPGLVVCADSNLLRHALTNLVKNAMEALAESESEPREIQIRAWKEQKKVWIIVRDTGPGMPESVRQRVFEPFYSTKKSGTGLGLTLVLQIVREHGGEVDCRSSPGKGTTFRLSIPT